MSTRYSRIFSLKGNLYTEGSPVVISAGALLLDNKKSITLAQLKFRNISDKRIKALSLTLISGADAEGKPIPTEYTYSGLDAEPDVSFGDDALIPIEDNKASELSIGALAVTFDDDGVWESGDASWRSIKQNKITSLIPDYYQQIAYGAKFGRRAVRVAVGNESLWACTCGAIHPAGATTCNVCSAEKSALTSIDPVALAREGALIVARARAMGNTIEELREAKAAIDTLDESEETKELREMIEGRLAELTRRKKRGRTIRNILLFVCLPAVLFAALAVLWLTVFLPSSNYDTAVELYRNEEYSDAYEYFNKLDDDYKYTLYYKSLIIEELTLKASEYASVEDYTNAYELLRPLVEDYGVEPPSDYYIYKGAATGDYELAIKSGIAYITIPEGVSEIKADAFSNVDTLCGVILPSSLTKIGALAFSGCSNLTYIYIPEAVTEIGEDAFLGCDRLNVYLERDFDAPDWPDDVFDSAYNVYHNRALITYTFITNGGTEIAPIKTIDSLAITLPTPTRENYIFLGWYTDDDEKINAPVYQSYLNTTLYAKWQSVNYGLTMEEAIDLSDTTYYYFTGETTKAYYFKYTPSAGGTFTFRGDSSIDVDATLMNSNGEVIITDIKSGDFFIGSYLIPGETYYLKVTAYTFSYDTFHCSITIN